MNQKKPNTGLSLQKGSRIVVIGNGMVGHYFINQLVQNKLHDQVFITVIGEEASPAYDRIHLTELFESKQKEELLLHTKDWYYEQGIRLYTADPAIFIDTKKQMVKCKTGAEFSYDYLVLATGSFAYKPPIQGMDSKNIFTYRDFKDIDAIQQKMVGKKSAAILGGGLLGLEAARAMQEGGLQATVVEYADFLLPRQLQPESAKVLQDKIQQTGIQLRISAKTKSIEPHDNGLRIEFKNQADLLADFVIVAAGVRPRDELAIVSGIECDPGGGIVINQKLETNLPNVFAIGECTSFDGERFGLAAPGFQMAEALCKRLLGFDSEYKKISTDTSLKFNGIPVSVVGDYLRPNCEYHLYNDGEHYRLIVTNDFFPIGMVQVGNWEEAPRLQECIRQKTRLSEKQLKIFTESGEVFEEQLNGISNWSAEAIVCNCMSIRKKELTACIAKGCEKIETLSEQTGAGTVCGSCKPVMAELLGTPITEIKKTSSIPFWVGATTCLLFLSLLLFTPSYTYATSVQDSNRYLEHYWLSSLWEQITGFTAFGLLFFSFVFSIKKKFPKMPFFSFSFWRTFHILLASLSLGVAWFHAGGSFGKGFNSSLMLLYTALQITGLLLTLHHALVGEPLTEKHRKLRQQFFQFHFYLSFPLPAFLLFHIFLAYYY